eukprot:8765398-Alexandrium_andersonii.AAC.1
MSASLVGSEMCIRDSCPTCRREAGPYAAEVTGAFRPPLRRPEKHRSSPVSYTHLTLPTICSV